MEEQYEYKGHSIHVWTTDVGKGAHRWSYTIDGKHYSEMSDRPLKSESLMLAEGKHEAEADAERLK